MTSLVLAAAGSGSRLGELTKNTPKCLVPEPAYGIPILGHLYAAISQACQIQDIIIVGGPDLSMTRQIVEFSEQFSFKTKPTIHAVSGERRGVGYAFFQGVEVARALGAHECILSISDGVARTYHELFQSEAPMILGVTLNPDESKKSFTSVWIDENGMVLPPSRDSGTKAFVRGVYNLRNEALDEYLELFRFALDLSAPSDSIVNKSGEFKVTWAWRAMQEHGMPIGAANLNEMAEANFPEELQHFRRLYNEPPSARSSSAR